jgi:hypothetical protein
MYEVSTKLQLWTLVLSSSHRDLYTERLVIARRGITLELDPLHMNHGLRGYSSKRHAVADEEGSEVSQASLLRFPFHILK